MSKSSLSKLRARLGKQLTAKHYALRVSKQLASIVDFLKDVPEDELNIEWLTAGFTRRDLLNLLQIRFQHVRSSQMLSSRGFEESIMSVESAEESAVFDGAAATAKNGAIFLWLFWDKSDQAYVAIEIRKT